MQYTDKQIPLTKLSFMLPTKYMLWIHNNIIYIVLDQTMAYDKCKQYLLIDYSEITCKYSNFLVMFWKRTRHLTARWYDQFVTITDCIPTHGTTRNNIRKQTNKDILIEAQTQSK